MPAASLPTENPCWGFWGTYQTNFDATEEETARAWAEMSAVLIEQLGISPELTRLYLDSRAGRHWADDLSFAPSQKTPGAVKAHMTARMARRSWRAELLSQARGLAAAA